MAMEDIVKRLRVPIPHHYCDDGWYSCPLSDDGCADEEAGDECTCGADYINDERKEAADRIERLRKENVRIRDRFLEQWGHSGATT